MNWYKVFAGLLVTLFAGAAVGGLFGSLVENKDLAVVLAVLGGGSVGYLGAQITILWAMD